MKILMRFSQMNALATVQIFFRTPYIFDGNMVVFRMYATNQSARLDGAVKYFPVSMDGIHDIHTSKPRVHKYCRKRRLFAANRVIEHTFKMIRFAFPIRILIINTKECFLHPYKLIYLQLFHLIC